LSEKCPFLGNFKLAQQPRSDDNRLLTFWTLLAQALPTRLVLEAARAVRFDQGDEHMQRRYVRWLAAILLTLAPGAAIDAAGGAEAALRVEAAKGLDRAIQFFRKQVATEGGYLWRYSADLSKREGEGKASATQVWVQPPGTPAVGMALLKAHQATGEKRHLDAVVDAARCLVRGQLRSGGWDYSIEFEPKRRQLWNYRVEEENPKGKNVSTLDDNTTQAALRLLMRADIALGMKDKEIHDAVRDGLDALLKTQYPNGAWPQRFEGPPDPAKFPVRKASYPASGPGNGPAATTAGTTRSTTTASRT
jgi:hypothetical protein